MGKDQYAHYQSHAEKTPAACETPERSTEGLHGCSEHGMCIWTADTPMFLKSNVLDPGVKDLIIADAREWRAAPPVTSSPVESGTQNVVFHSVEATFLFGDPGGGKTSLINSMASKLELDVYTTSISRIGLNDAGLDSLIDDLPERCVSLMEGIDAAFIHGLTREPEENSKDSDILVRVGLNGLLNAPDELGARGDHIILATTNKYSSLDPALCRSGCMDLHIEFKLSSKYQARELFKRFYNPSDSPDDVVEVVGLGDGDMEAKLESDSGYILSNDDVMETSEDSSKPVVSGSMHRRRAEKKVEKEKSKAKRAGNDNGNETGNETDSDGDAKAKIENSRRRK
ncbi:mitochondrial chaperone bcs1 [Moniliophthora roreri MCA 2997]|uniref:Mitochondrial chaperone bcs1 n=1 Tax=Moniliophthora roreri (strain MCA 2997) TaxID=1381753 RepID=V2XEA3_MONRO|nr:mitochondrial chaperone bcs1 [Moniliophthora roreri MCA 2997]